MSQSAEKKKKMLPDVLQPRSIAGMKCKFLSGALHDMNLQHSVPACYVQADRLSDTQLQRIHLNLRRATEQLRLLPLKATCTVVILSYFMREQTRDVYQYWTESWMAFIYLSFSLASLSTASGTTRGLEHPSRLP